MVSPPDPSLAPFERLVELMRILRAPGGCAWDAKQTHKSLIPYLVEETYEVIDALEQDDSGRLKEELGDLLVQFVFHGEIAQESGKFTIDESIRAVIDKLIRRHPHVFADNEQSPDAVQVRQQWERQKLAEKGPDGRPRLLLDGIPKSMPALNQAFRLGEKAAGVGYDWRTAEDVLEKVREEVEELAVEVKSRDKQKQAEEIGDLLFVVASLARKLEIDPEQALKISLRKFHERFKYIEKQVLASGKGWQEFTLEQLEAWWVESKRE